MLLETTSGLSHSIHGTYIYMDVDRGHGRPIFSGGQKDGGIFGDRNGSRRISWPPEAREPLRVRLRRKAGRYQEARQEASGVRKEVLSVLARRQALFPGKPLGPHLLLLRGFRSQSLHGHRRCGDKVANNVADSL